MDEAYLLATVRYVERNPVAARICRHPAGWPWSSAAAHIAGKEDSLVSVKPMLDRIDDWETYLSVVQETQITNQHIQQHTRTGRPLGSSGFIDKLELLTGKELARKKPGRKPAETTDK